MIRFGPGGNSKSFYDDGLQHTYQAAEWLHKKGLNAFEYSFGRGINISKATAHKIRDEFKKYDIQISAHSPYYINFANKDAELIKKSFGYVSRSIKMVQEMGGNRVVFHPASLGKMEREEAFGLALNNIGFLVEYLKASGLNDFKICAESMGKHGQIGTVEEIIEICKLDDCIYPCLDFGHINSFTLGGLKTKDDYRKVIDQMIDNLGEKAMNMHIHFSKIMYGNKGELKHLTFEDKFYGPEYPPLAEIIDEYKMTPFVICESDGTMAEDAITMKNTHKQV